MSRGRALALSAVTVTIATFLGRIFGFARETVLAHKFGASAQMDAFLTAFAIPNFLYSLIIMGALNASFIPVFSGLLADEREKEAWRLASVVFSIILIGFGLIILGLTLFAPQVILLITPGFRGTATLGIASELLRLMAPSLILLGISGLMAGILNSYNHFMAPSLVALVQNVVMVASIVLLADKMGLNGVAVGLLLGSLGQVLVQIPVFVKHKIPLKISFSISHEKILDVGKLFLPVLVALGASQSNVIIDKTFASYLSSGSISYLNYAYKVASLPVSTLIAAIAIVLFPTFSKQAAKNDIPALRRTISIGIRMVTIVAIPASVGLLVLSTPIVRLLYERGRFTELDTLETAPVLFAYSLGLLMMGLNMLLVRAFYSLKDGSTPLKASLVFVVALVGSDFVLMRLFDQIGLALGYVLAMTIMVFMMAKALHHRLNGLYEDTIIRSTLKSLAAAIGMGIATYFSYELMHSLLGSSTKINELLNVTVSISLGLMAYLTGLIILRAEEISLIRGTIAAKLSRVGT
jgi:putative peptidoglycan lipid II flippase